MSKPPFTQIYDIGQMDNDGQVKSLPVCKTCGSAASHASRPAAPFPADTVWLCSECAEVKMYEARVIAAQKFRESVYFHVRRLNQILAEAEAEGVNIRLTPVAASNNSHHTSTLVAEYALPLFGD